jgi:hypothetical protein
MGTSLVWARYHKTPAYSTGVSFRVAVGGATGARTPDLLHAMQMLFQLSYRPVLDIVANRCQRGWRGLPVPPRGPLRPTMGHVFIDLNADVGEGLDAADAAILPLISSANIACGGHAGDERSMARIVELALRHDVAIGAHPATLSGGSAVSTAGLSAAATCSYRPPAGTRRSARGRRDHPPPVSQLPTVHVSSAWSTDPTNRPCRPWPVTPRSDRVGLRLEGPPIAAAGLLDLASLPMLPGAIQLLPNGQPIVLMPDAPTVGGYPVPAVVAEADRRITAQLRPGDELRFEWLSREAARERARQRRTWLLDMAAALE